MSCLNSQGPNVYPMSPARATSANEGSHASNERLVDGGEGCSSSHFLPFTAVGRNSVPSSAMKAKNASRVPFSFEALANALSVSTSEVIVGTGTFFCTVAVPARTREQIVKQRTFFIRRLLSESFGEIPVGCDAAF